MESLRDTFEGVSSVSTRKHTHREPVYSEAQIRNEADDTRKTQVADSGGNLLIPGEHNLLQSRKAPKFSRKMMKRLTTQTKQTDQKYAISNINKSLLRRAKSTLFTTEIILAILALASCLVAILENFQFHENGYESNLSTSFLRGIVTLLSVATVSWIWRRYRIKLCIKLIQQEVTIVDNLITTGQYKAMLVEMALWAIHWPLGVDATFMVEILNFETEYSVNDILTAITCLRVYQVLRLISYLSFYTKEKSQRVCQIYGFETNFIFAMKAVIRDNPYSAVGLLYAAFSIIAAYAIHIAERNEKKFNDGTQEQSDLDTYWNSLWLWFVTSSTVGYGEMVPETHLGRFAATIVSIIGNFFLGLFVVALASSLYFEKDQFVSYVKLLANKRHRKIHQTAKRMVQLFCTIVILNRRNYNQAVGKQSTAQVSESETYVSHNGRTTNISIFSEEVSQVTLLFPRLWQKLSTQVRIFKQLKREHQQLMLSDSQILRDIGIWATYHFSNAIWKMRFIAENSTLLQASNLIMNQQLMEKLAKTVRVNAWMIQSKQMPVNCEPKTIDIKGPAKRTVKIQNISFTTVKQEVTDNVKDSLESLITKVEVIEEAKTPPISKEVTFKPPPSPVTPQIPKTFSAVSFTEDNISHPEPDHYSLKKHIEATKHASLRLATQREALIGNLENLNKAISSDYMRYMA